MSKENDKGEAAIDGHATALVAIAQLTVERDALQAQHDELLEWQREAVKTSERRGHASCFIALAAIWLNGNGTEELINTHGAERVRQDLNALLPRGRWADWQQLVNLTVNIERRQLREKEGNK